MQVMFNLPSLLPRQGVYGVGREVLVPVQEVILLSLQTTVTNWLNKKAFLLLHCLNSLVILCTNKSREAGEDS